MEDVGLVSNGIPLRASLPHSPLTGINTGSDCPGSTSSQCLRCNDNGCVKCPAFIVIESRECVDSCPKGYVDQWSSHTEFMGRVCLAGSGYSGSLLAALSGIFAGLLVCLLILAIGMFCIRRRHKLLRGGKKSSKALDENRLERAEFLQQIGEMRPYAGHFLCILNDIRRQIRKSYMGGELDTIQSVRPLIRDLARILLLLNRPPELLTVPPKDWPHLYAWMLQVVQRPAARRWSTHRVSSSMMMSSQSQFMTLNDSQTTVMDRLPICTFPDNFHGSGKFELDEDAFTDQDLHLLRKNGGGRLTHSLKPHFFDSSVSLRDESQALNPLPFGDQMRNILNNGGCLLKDFHGSSLWLEDEFNMLGLRPQDEITTEL